MANYLSQSRSGRKRWIFLARICLLCALCVFAREMPVPFPDHSSSTTVLPVLPCESPAQVDALYARVLEHGHRGHKAPWDAFWGQRYAVVLDPDGNLVDLFAAL